MNNSIDLTDKKPQASKRKKLGKWKVGLLSLFVFSSGCYIIYLLLATPQKQTSQRPLPVPVERTNLKVTVTANGNVEPKESVNVSPKTAGILKTLLVSEGERVKKGQALAKMDDSDLQGKLLEIQGKVAQAEANLKKLTAGNRPQEIAQARSRTEELEANLKKLTAGNRPQEIAQAEANYNSALANYNRAEEEYRRYKILADEGAVSQDVLSQKQTARDMAKSSLTASQQAYDLAKVGSRQEDIQQALWELKRQQQVYDLLKAGSRQEDIEQAQASVTSAKGELKTIQTQIDDTTIRAPFDGIISRKYADPGAFVTPTTAGSSVTSATSSSILSIVSTNQVIANVSESSISKIRVGQAVEITADAYPGKTFSGTVSKIATIATVSQNVTSFEIEITLAPLAAEILKSGMNVSANFKVDELKNILTVPSVAVTRQDNVTGVFVGEPNSPPRFVPITTGATVNNRTEVKSGLTGSEHILVNATSKNSPPSPSIWEKLLGGGNSGDRPRPPSGGPGGGNSGPP